MGRCYNHCPLYLIKFLKAQANSLRGQLDECDATRERLEAAVEDAQRDVGKMRVEMNELREKMRTNERNAMQNDDELGRIKHELEMEQTENGKILSHRDELSRQVQGSQ